MQANSYLPPNDKTQVKVACLVIYPTTHLDFYLGQSVLLTTHPDPLPHLSQLWLTYQQDMTRWPYGLDYLLYQLLHHLTTLSPAIRQTIQATRFTLTEDQPDTPLPWP